MTAHTFRLRILFYHKYVIWIIDPLVLLIAHFFPFIVIVSNDNFVNVGLLAVFKMKDIVNMTHQVCLSLLL